MVRLDVREREGVLDLLSETEGRLLGRDRRVVNPLATTLHIPLLLIKVASKSFQILLKRF